MELFLAIIVYPVIVWRMKETNSYKGVFFAVLFTIIFMFAGYLVGVKVLENIVFYKKAEDKYGMVYSSKLLKCWSTSRAGRKCNVRLLNDTGSTNSLRIEECYKLPNKYNLIVFPKLGHNGEIWYYPVYHKRLYEVNPTDVQLEYCKNGARLSEKISNLKKYSGVTSKEKLIDYISHIRQHNNRIISAVVENRGEKYTFVNVIQSDDKLWALKYRNVNEGKKILIIYDLNSPSLYTVVNWNPSEEEYEYYKTKEGNKPSEAYLELMESVLKEIGTTNNNSF